MSMLRRLIPNTVAMQITGLVVVSLLLGNALTFAIATYQFRHNERGTHPESAAAQIVTLAELLTRAKSLDEFWNILDGAKTMGVGVENASVSSLVATPSLPQEPSFLKRAVEKLAAERGLKLLKLQPDDGGSEFVVVDRGAEEALVFRIPSSPEALPLLHGPALTTLTVATLSLLVLSAYAVRWITAPLRSFAEAADDFGRTLKNNQPLNERGPREIAQTARAQRHAASYLAFGGRAHLHADGNQPRSTHAADAGAFAERTTAGIRSTRISSGGFAQNRRPFSRHDGIPTR